MLLGLETILVTTRFEWHYLSCHSSTLCCRRRVQMHYCGCDIQLHSVVAVSDDDEVPVISDPSSWASLYRPQVPTIADPNEAPTEVAPSIPALEEGETHSIPETPCLEPEKGALPPEDAAVGDATRIEGREVMTQHHLSFHV